MKHAAPIPTNTGAARRGRTGIAALLAAGIVCAATVAARGHHDDRHVVSAPTGAPLMAEPSFTARVVTRVPLGATVRPLVSADDRDGVRGTTAGWIRVRYGKRTGWIWCGHVASAPSCGE